MNTSVPLSSSSAKPLVSTKIDIMNHIRNSGDDNYQPEAGNLIVDSRIGQGPHPASLLFSSNDLQSKQSEEIPSTLITEVTTPSILTTIMQQTDESLVVSLPVSESVVDKQPHSYTFYETVNIPRRRIRNFKNNEISNEFISSSHPPLPTVITMSVSDDTIMSEPVLRNRKRRRKRKEDYIENNYSDSDYLDDDFDLDCGSDSNAKSNNKSNLEERKNHAKTRKKDDINKTNDILKTSINNTENDDTRSFEGRESDHGENKPVGIVELDKPFQCPHSKCGRTFTIVRTRP